MNVILEVINGVVQTPLLIKKDTTALATFRSLAVKHLGDDLTEMDLMDSDTINDDVNKLLEGTGIELLWFMDIVPNKY
jgi:hypothetical protein